MTKIKTPFKKSINSANLEVNKNDFIKLNVSPEFKALAVEAALDHLNQPASE